MIRSKVVKCSGFCKGCPWKKVGAGKNEKGEKVKGQFPEKCQEREDPRKTTGVTEGIIGVGGLTVQMNQGG